MDIKTFYIKEKDILLELKKDLKKTLKYRNSESNVKANRTGWWYYTEEKGKDLFDKIKLYFSDLNIPHLYLQVLKLYYVSIKIYYHLLQIHSVNKKENYFHKLHCE